VNSRIAGLYAITPDLADTDDLLYRVRAALAGGARVLQYRNKSASTQLRLTQARALQALCAARGVPLIINDRVDIALAVEADGVHVGQTDMPVEMVRALLGPGAIIGLSITNHGQISRPDAALPDYLGLGPLYLQQTKPNAATPLGVEGFRALRAATTKPVVAIGGLKADNSAPVLAAGADGLAVVSAIVGAPDVRAATEDFMGLFGG
jgi:thiamine-phosphate pyrophosphorylase